jgi:hypothetical protein
MEVGSTPSTVPDMLRSVTMVHSRRKMLPDIFRHDKNPFISSDLKSASNPAHLQRLLDSCWEGRLWLANFVEGTRSQQDFPLRLESILSRAGITAVLLAIDEEPGLDLEDLGPAARDGRMEATLLELKQVRADHRVANESALATRAADIAGFAQDQTLVPVDASMLKTKSRSQILALVGQDLCRIFGIRPGQLTTAWVSAYQKCAPQYDRMCRLHRGDLKITDIVQHVLKTTDESFALGMSLEILKYLGLGPSSPSRSIVTLPQLTEEKFVAWLGEVFRKHAVQAFSKNSTWAQYRPGRSFKPLDSKTPDAKSIAVVLRSALDFAGAKLRGCSERGAKRAITHFEFFWLWDIPPTKGAVLPRPRPKHPKDFVVAIGAHADGSKAGDNPDEALKLSQRLNADDAEDLSQEVDYIDDAEDDLLDFTPTSFQHARTPANLSRTDESSALPPAPKRHALGAATPQLEAPSAGRPSKRRVSSVPPFILDPDATGSPAKDHGRPKPAKALRQARHSDSDEEVLVNPRWRKQKSKSITGSQSSLPP